MRSDFLSCSCELLSAVRPALVCLTSTSRIGASFYDPTSLQDLSRLPVQWQVTHDVLTVVRDTIKLLQQAEKRLVSSTWLVVGFCTTL